MADVKLSELSQAASIATTDLVGISQDAGGSSYDSRKVAFSTLKYESSTLDVTEFSSNVSPTVTNQLLVGNAAGGQVYVSLPAAVNVSGKVYCIKKVDSTINAVTIDADGSETIDGDLTIDITGQYDALTVVSNGTSWLII